MSGGVQVYKCVSVQVNKYLITFKKQRYDENKKNHNSAHCNNRGLHNSSCDMVIYTIWQIFLESN